MVGTPRFAHPAAYALAPLGNVNALLIELGEARAVASNCRTPGALAVESRAGKSRMIVVGLRAIPGQM